MNGVSISGLGRGVPATAVIKLSADRPLRAPQPQKSVGDELLLISVVHPPRTGETRPIAALMPQVLARYGLGEATDAQPAATNALDVLA